MSEQEEQLLKESDEALDGVPDDAVEALPADLHEKLAGGDARLAGEKDVFVDPDETRWIWEEIRLKGEDLVVGFELRDISWQRKNQIFKNNISTNPKADTQFKIDTFMREVAEEVVVSHTIETNRSITQLLAGMDNNVGERLEPHLPQPGGVELEEDEEKN